MATKQLIEKHAKVKNDFVEHINRLQTDEREQVVSRLKASLHPSERRSLTHVLDVLGVLERNKIIGCGNYEFLKTVVEEFDVDIVDAVLEPAEQEINNMKGLQKNE